MPFDEPGRRLGALREGISQSQWTEDGERAPGMSSRSRSKAGSERWKVGAGV